MVRSTRSQKVIKMISRPFANPALTCTSLSLLTHPLNLANFPILSLATKTLSILLVNHVACPLPKSVTTVNIGISLPVSLPMSRTLFWGTLVIVGWTETITSGE